MFPTPSVALSPGPYSSAGENPCVVGVQRMCSAGLSRGADIPGDQGGLPGGRAPWREGSLEEGLFEQEELLTGWQWDQRVRLAEATAGTEALQVERRLGWNEAVWLG